MKYNYVIFGSSDDMYIVSYGDLFNEKNVKYIWKPIDSKNNLLINLYRLHTSPSTNKLIKLPFQRIWNKYSFSDDFQNDLPICFIFFSSRKRLIDNGLIDYLRKHYKDCKMVIFYQDLVKKSSLNNMDFIKEKFDMVLSFDHMDAKQYGLIYYPLVYSSNIVTDCKDLKVKESDVYFVGKAKDRLNQILKTYEVLTNAGLKCDFHVTGVSENDMKYSDRISYNKPLNYYENLQHIQKTKCLLEIMQQGGHGYTLRYCEAITYNKKIITNNPEIKDAPFYNSSFIQVIQNIDEIDTNFIASETIVDYKFKNELSPKKLLEFIDNNLNQ